MGEMQMTTQHNKLNSEEITEPAPKIKILTKS